MTEIPAMQVIGDKVIAGKVSIEFHRAVRVEAAKRDRTISDAVREGLELWLDLPGVCPQCSTPTVDHPDLLIGPVIRWCPNCQESVEFNGK